MDGLAPVAADSGPSAEEDGGFLTKLSSMFGKEKEPAQISSFNPLDYPEIHGVPRVITGSVLRVRGIDVKLLRRILSKTALIHAGRLMPAGIKPSAGCKTG